LTLSAICTSTSSRFHEAGHGVAGDERGDPVGRLGTFGPEPLGGPIERTEKGARGDSGVCRCQFAPPDAGGDERADLALVSIALGHDQGAQPGRERIDLEVRGGPFHLIENAEYMGDSQGSNPPGQRGVAGAREFRSRQKAIQRPILAEEQDLVLPGEVVVEVSRRQIGGDRDLAHPRGGESPRAEDVCGSAEDLDPPEVGAACRACICLFRTAVRKMNHGSSVTGFKR
jgi:hypothetical protein